ncbi:nuclear transport factor 2 family protein [Sphingomonas hengshuiensis]|uniref:DUF4440 domain-containing protein n=1 Tax=Sphingomonas hengshuiensis TaxID=1609977 RepID=A0A7U4J9C3_9SPHN|nr:nuclear transport factor 2 family protein [Sphingomonas hengshuiensis]AJP72645.1 hypothetical protein TS85_13965 [Sphingomonas hengshuiensis]
MPLSLLLAAACPASALPAPAPADAPLIRLVTEFVAAEEQFDQARLAELTTPDYAEVSPLGELDQRDAFLGFYAADKKRPAPATMVCEPFVRQHGNAATVIARLGFDLPGAPGQPPRAVAFRATFLALRSGDAWKLASAHYTPLRLKPAAN